MKTVFRCLTQCMVGAMMVLVLMYPGSLAAATGYRGVAFERNQDGGIGTKLAGVVITFVSESGRARYTATTDSKGSYSINLPAARYRVTASLPGYEDYSSNPGFFVVTGKTYQTGNIFLKKKLFTTVLLIRHAEKAAAPADDPPLTAAGQTRANELVHVAAKAGIKAIFATNTIRTRQTVQPLATYYNLPITTYNNNTSLKNTIMSNYAGKTVIVVGHSPTIQSIVTALGANASNCQVNDSEFDNLFVITIYGSDTANVVNLQYGAVSP